MGMSTDASEVVAAIASTAALLFCLYALYHAIAIWKESTQPNSEIAHLRSMALRKCRQTGFWTLFCGVIVLCTTTTLWMPIGEIQSAIRNNTLQVVSLLAFFRAGIEYWEQRAVDTRDDERHDGGRRETDRKAS